MLVVLGIIGILAAISVPAVIGMSKASRGTSGLSLVMSTLDQARNQAIAQAANTYVYFATNDASWPKEYRGRTFGIFSEAYNAANADQPYMETQIGKWSTLPDGVCFKPDTSATIFGGTPVMTYFAPTKASLPMVRIKFSPMGEILEPLESSRTRVRLFEGYFSGDGTPVATNPAGSAGEYNIKLVPLTGRAMREEALHTP